VDDAAAAVAPAGASGQGGQVEVADVVAELVVAADEEIGGMAARRARRLDRTALD
jgi:hypothetical protein